MQEGLYQPSVFASLCIFGRTLLIFVASASLASTATGVLDTVLSAVAMALFFQQVRSLPRGRPKCGRNTVRTLILGDIHWEEAPGRIPQTLKLGPQNLNPKAETPNPQS
jgi:hypothetical protein